MCSKKGEKQKSILKLFTNSKLFDKLSYVKTNERDGYIINI